MSALALVTGPAWPWRHRRMMSGRRASINPEPALPQDPAKAQQARKDAAVRRPQCWSHEDHPRVEPSSSVAASADRSSRWRCSAPASRRRSTRPTIGPPISSVLLESGLQRHRCAARHRRRSRGARRRVPDAAHGDVERQRQAARRGGQWHRAGRRHDQPDDPARARCIGRCATKRSAAASRSSRANGSSAPRPTAAGVPACFDDGTDGATGRCWSARTACIRRRGG